MKYEIFKEKNIRINRKEINNTIKKFVKLFRIDSDKYLSIAFVSPSTIKKLNHQYRKINKATDVLSFDNQDSSNRTKGLIFFNSNFLGEIIICYKQAVFQAKENHITVNDEIKKLLTHGLVHLMGYDHKTPQEMKKMNNKEREILGQ